MAPQKNMKEQLKDMFGEDNWNEFLVTWGNIFPHCDNCGYEGNPNQFFSEQDQKEHIVVYKDLKTKESHYFLV